MMISTRVFNRFREIIYDYSGISLSTEKKELLCMRVRKNMAQLEIEDIKAYLEVIESDKSGAHVVDLLDAISTNVTSFFREPHHFEMLKERLTEMRDQGVSRIRMWSAACSSGEEPYSMAMIAQEVFEKTLVDWKILATDISTEMLKAAQDGIYREKHTEGISYDLLDKYFQRSVNGSVHYTIADKIKQRVVFRRANLANPPFPLKGPLDFVFCRNVMIYFDDAVRAKLLAEINRLLDDDGILFVGHAESLTGLVGKFKCIKPTIYNKQRFSNEK